MSDILTRLRAPMNRDEFFKVANGLCMDAADEIERITAALAEAQKDRDYWKIEAEGERAKVDFRDKQLERYRLTNTEENDLSILAREIDVAARALKEKP